MTTDPDVPLPLPLAEPQGPRRVWCRAGCRHELTSRASRARGYGPRCWDKLGENTAPQPPAHTVEQEPIPGV